MAVGFARLCGRGDLVNRHIQNCHPRPQPSMAAYARRHHTPGDHKGLISRSRLTTNSTSMLVPTSATTLLSFLSC